jgi:hypothetical protein
LRIPKEGAVHRLPGGLFGDDLDHPVAGNEPPNGVGDQRGDSESRHANGKADAEAEDPAGVDGDREGGQEGKADEQARGDEVQPERQGIVLMEPWGEGGESRQQQEAAERRPKREDDGDRTDGTETSKGSQRASGGISGHRGW